MNGWQRLFVVAVVATGLPTLAIALSDAPTRAEDGGESVYGCSLNDNHVTPARAREYLKSGVIPQADTYLYDYANPLNDRDCAEAMEGVLTGALFTARHDAWRDGIWAGVAAFTGFWAVVYALGAALGWVWRGFFPRSTAA